MQLHMTSMQKMMDMMKGNKKQHMTSEKGMKDKDMKSMNMDKRIEMMEEHMGMMQMMMEQMINHDNEAMHADKSK